MGVPLSEKGRRRWRWAWRRVYRMRTLVGVAAGLISVGTFAYSYFWHSLPTTITTTLAPAPSPYGEIVAIIQDAKTMKPLGDANIEIATDMGVILTTLTSGGDGRAHHKVKEGGYTLRITHSTFGPETRTVRVNAGETSEVHVTLAAAAPEEGDVKKFFKGLFGL